MENKIIIVETERLILRKFKKEDAQDLFEYLSDKEVVKYEPYKPLTFDETKENLEWRIGTNEMIAVELKSIHKMIGNIYLGKRDLKHWKQDMCLIEITGDKAMQRKVAKP